MPRWPLLTLLLSLPAAAQTATITVPPLFVLPNEGRNPAGQIEGIEGGAFTARARLLQPRRARALEAQLRQRRVGRLRVDVLLGRGR